LRTDGSVTCWGKFGRVQTTPSAGTFTQISAGGYHTCALRIDGSVTCWGDFVLPEKP
jgi:alpha-tubulin suppressor-like RCC1 family protein